MQNNIVAGIVSLPGAHSVDMTIAKAQQLLAERDIHLFALVDHSGDAARLGIHMPATKLLIFGNAAAGTPVILSAPSSAIDLPLKLLVWEDPQGKTWLSYNSHAYLQERHHIPPEVLAKLNVITSIAEQAAK